MTTTQQQQQQQQQHHHHHQQTTNNDNNNNNNNNNNKEKAHIAPVLGGGAFGHVQVQRVRVEEVHVGGPRAQLDLGAGVPVARE